MRVASFILLALVLAGCTTKSAAQREAQAAFLAGQQQSVQGQPTSGQNVQVIGNVKNHSVEWTDGLSLSQALVAAEWQEERDPLDIFIFRRGQMIAVKPRDLLLGRDHLLEPGDRIEVRR